MEGFHSCTQIKENYLTCVIALQQFLHDGVRHGLPPQRGGETQEASDRADDVGQTDRPLRQRRLRHGDAASVPASVHLHRLHGRRLARQTALRAATSRSTPEQ